MNDDLITPAIFEGEEVDGILITKWVVVAEFVKPDGKRGLARQWSESCAPWDVAALLTAGLEDWDSSEEDEDAD